MKIEECWLCKGNGLVKEEICPVCNGIGKTWIDDEECPVVELPETFDNMFPDFPIRKSVDLSDYNDPCAGCSNNPKNNPKNNPYASGVCGYTLPYITRSY